MTLQPDIIISWDISKKDIPTIVITEIKYDDKIKNVVGNVLARIDATEPNAISVNQIIDKYYLNENNKLIKQIEEKLNEMQEDKQ